MNANKPQAVAGQGLGRFAWVGFFGGAIAPATLRLLRHKLYGEDRKTLGIVLVDVGVLGVQWDRAVLPTKGVER